MSKKGLPFHQQNYIGYKKSVIKNIKNKKGKDSFDGLLLISATLMQSLTVAFVILSVILMFFSLKKTSFIISIFLMTAILITFPTLIAFLALRFLNKPIKPMLKGLFTFWFFLLSWMPIHVLALFKKDTTWKEIKHKPIEVE